MADNRIHLGSLQMAWRGWWHSPAPQQRRADCAHVRGLWRRLQFGYAAVRLEGARYCLDRCLETAIGETLGRKQAVRKAESSLHRVPLGLLLLARHELTLGQLQAALAAQREAGRGRIGEWLQAMGFVSEFHVTAALAQQWRCPILRSDASIAVTSFIPAIPRTLLESLSMVPIDYIESRRTLYLAFGEKIDYSVLYTIEQMIECRTEACLAAPSWVQRGLEQLSPSRTKCEIVFEQVSDNSEIARIIRGYCCRLRASEIRMGRCVSYLWVRLLRGRHLLLDVLLGSRLSSPTA